MDEVPENSQPTERTLRIRLINDAVRKCAESRDVPFIDGEQIHLRITMAASLGDRIIAEGGDDSPLVNLITNAIANFTDFNEESDPYGEHDYGSFKVEIDGEDRLIMFKIDYYNIDLTEGSEDPADVSQTTYVLTIFFAEDY